MLTTAGVPVGRIDQTAKTITLVRNDKWWATGQDGHDRVPRDRTYAQIDALANARLTS